MLRRRPIDRFKIISLADDATDSLSDKLIKEYTDKDRDWSIIAERMRELEQDKTNEIPAVFICEPLKPAYDGMSISSSVTDYKQIFAAHVKGIENVDKDLEPQFVRREESLYLTMEYVDSFPLVVVIDVAGTIIRRGHCDTSPFSLPDGFWQVRGKRFARRRVVEAVRAVQSKETVIDDSTKNASEKT